MILTMARYTGRRARRYADSRGIYYHHRYNISLDSVQVSESEVTLIDWPNQLNGHATLFRVSNATLRFQRAEATLTPRRLFYRVNGVKFTRQPPRTLALPINLLPNSRRLYDLLSFQFPIARIGDFENSLPIPHIKVTCSPAP